MQAGQCGNQMGTKFSEVVCDEYGTGGGGEYCGGFDAHRPHQRVLPRGLGRQVRSRAVLMDLEPGVIDYVSLNRRSAN